MNQPYTYTGREYDPETGLYYYGARYYDAHTGRFLQEDPIFDQNLYAYCWNNPLNLVDPFGLRSYTEKETMSIIKRAVIAGSIRGEGPFLGWTGWMGWTGYENLYRNHTGYGKYDFKKTEPDSTFVVNGECITASEFENYIAAYAAQASKGGLGYSAVIFGGQVFALFELTRDFDFLDWNSIPWIQKGGLDARTRE